MAQISVQPQVLAASLLSIGSDSYETHVSSVTFTPSFSTVDWTGMDGTVHSFVTRVSWTVTLEYAQDWETASSLSQKLQSDFGQVKAVTFEPTAGGAGFTSNVTFAPGQIGGAINSVGTGSVTLPCTEPVLVPAE
ncbi:MAG: hypothetical protein ACTHMQ_05300 [Protaetiibacter sp.]